MTKNKELGASRKRDRAATRVPSAKKRTPSGRSDPLRKETKHDRMGRMVLEVAAAIGFRRSELGAMNRSVYLLAFVDGARFVQAANRKARELAKEREPLSALRIGGEPKAVAKRPKPRKAGPVAKRRGTPKTKKP